MLLKRILIYTIILLNIGCSSTNKNISIVKENEQKKLTKALKIIDRYYIEKVDTEKLGNNIKKVMNNLDKHSIYINYNDKITKKRLTKSYSSKIIDKDYLYIKLLYFTKNSVKNITQSIRKNNNIKSIVLDLRDNPGGFLDQGIKTVDLFVDNGLIVSKRGRDIHNVTKYRATKSSTITSLPVVILVNSLSASSAEIVSGALQDLKRATIIGKKTYGKGTIQALIYITENKKEAIKLTIAKYYLPSGRLLDNKIIPDIEISDNQLDYAVNFLKNKRL